ncbi:TlpA family protein disulfide reductase [Gracilimonas amylolytica]|jgi:thiol-disulfide isomerase/thioredoxin|uniref:TlpA family protein disulfide reductase n=1 Tax=Gracilimonas amylolytica TaxID=1749045 RepID=UPI000CD8ECD0|nr:TlpA disulfide reductase family protein [Gracilimonas amylolytica]
MRKLILPILGLVFIGLLTACDARKNPRDLSKQDTHIDEVIWNATFYDLEGNEVSIQDYSGKVVMVDFWETWCSPCLQVFPAMDSLQKEYSDDFVMLAVNLNNSDTQEDVENFKSDNDYTFNYVLDKNRVGAEVITLGIPFKVFFDPEGFLIKSELGLSGNDYNDAKEIIEQHKTS